MKEKNIREIKEWGVAILISLSLLLFCDVALAEEGKGVFEGIMPDFKASFSQIKILLYVGEGATAIWLFMKSRDYRLFAGLGAVIMFTKWLTTAASL